MGPWLAPRGSPLNNSRPSPRAGASLEGLLEEFVEQFAKLALGQQSRPQKRTLSEHRRSSTVEVDPAELRIPAFVVSFR